MKRRRWPVALHTFESQCRPFAYTITVCQFDLLTHTGKILPILCKVLINQSINQSINQ